MKMIKMKFRKPLAIIIALCLLLPTILVVSTAGIKNNADVKEALKKLTTEERKIVDDISNLTGAKVEEIIDLKDLGYSWNEILERLKNKGQNNQQDRADRNKLLAENNLGEDYLKKLLEEGFSQNEITEAKMLVERVIFQLKEITEFAGDTLLLPSEKPEEGKKDDIEAYRELAGKIEFKNAVYLILKLKKDFGSLEKAMDEYLYVLQAEISLELYLKDKDAYEKEKLEKSASINGQKLITLEKIEAKMLEVIQNKNTKNRGFEDNETSGIQELEKMPGLNMGKEDLPPSPVPDVGNMRPKAPGEDVMKEVNDIRDKALSPD